MRLKSTLLILAISTAQICYATHVYQTQTLDNGTKVNICIFDNGKKGYCTAKDAENASKYQVQKMKAQADAQAKKTEGLWEKFTVEFPIVKKYDEAISQYSAELKEMERKRTYGLPYDENKYQAYATILGKLKNVKGTYSTTTTAVFAGDTAVLTQLRHNGIYVDSINEMYNRYANLNLSLKENKINQDEYTYLIKEKCAKNAIELENLYNNIVNGKSLTSVKGTLNNAVKSGAGTATSVGKDMLRNVIGW